MIVVMHLPIVLLGATLFVFGVAGTYAAIPAAGALLVFLIISAREGSVSRGVVLAVALLIGWLGWELLLTPLVLEPVTHLKYLAFTLLLTVGVTVGTEALVERTGRMAVALVYGSGIFAIISIVALVLYLIDPGPFSYKSTFQNRNGFAIFSTTLAGLLLGIWPVLQARQRVVAASVIVILGGLIVFSLSVKGVVGFLVVVALLSVDWARIRWRNAGYVAIFVAVMILIVYSYEPLWRRVEEVIWFAVAPERLAVGGSAWLRLQMIAMGLTEIARHPVTGIGLFHSKFLYTVFFEDTYSHNNYIEMMLNGGIPALALFYAPICLSLVVIVRNGVRRNALRRAAVVLGVYKLIMDFGMVSYFDPTHILIAAFVVFVAIRPNGSTSKALQDAGSR